MFGLAVVDLTTGDFKATELPSEAALLTEMDRLRPAETVVPSEAIRLQELLQARAAGVLNPFDDWVFAPETAQFTVREHFKVASLMGLVCGDGPPPSGGGCGPSLPDNICVAICPI